MYLELEKRFDRAFRLSFCRNKLLFVFPVLVVGGLIVVLCRTLAVDAHEWMVSSFTFLPIFLCAGLMMMIGILVIRIYHDEVKGKILHYQHILWRSRTLIGKIFFLIVPLLSVYLILWISLGVFYLLKSIPQVGNALGLIFSFAPFLLILSSLALSLLSLLLVFFVTPRIALRGRIGWEDTQEIYKQVKGRVFAHLLCFFIGLIPLLVVIGFLSLAAALTGTTYLITERTFAIFLQWFFIMLPFAALLSPAVVFFFNFAAESFAWIQAKGS